MRALLTLLFYTTTFGSGLILMLSVGWLLGLFGIGLLPIIIVHFIAGSRALNLIPLLNKWIIASCGCFLLFALLRPDMDDSNTYTGYSVMLHNAGLISSRYVHSQDFYFYIATVFLLITLGIDIAIIRKSRKPTVTPEPMDFV